MYGINYQLIVYMLVVFNMSKSRICKYTYKYLDEAGYT